MLLSDVSVHTICIDVVCSSKTLKVDYCISETEGVLITRPIHKCIGRVICRYRS